MKRSNRTFVTFLLAAFMVGVGLSACNGCTGIKKEVVEVPYWLRGETVVVSFSSDPDKLIQDPDVVKSMENAFAGYETSQPFQIPNRVSMRIMRMPEKFSVPEGFDVTYTYRIENGMILTKGALISIDNSRPYEVTEYNKHLRSLLLNGYPVFAPPRE